MMRLLEVVYVRVFVTVALLLTVVPVSASAQSETVEYYGLDALGSVRVVFDGQGDLVDRMDYAPFGEALRAGIKFPVEQFAQLSRDVEAGQDYAQARNYAASTGRFNRVDPVYAALFEPQKWNRYSYASNNPVGLIDPTGLDGCPVHPEFGEIAYCEEVEAGDSYDFWASWDAFMAWVESGRGSLRPVSDGSPSGKGDGIADDPVQALMDECEANPDSCKPQMAGLPNGPVAAGAAVATAANLGRVGEQAVRSVFNIGTKVAININGRIRIPDGLTSTTLSEIKNVRYLSLTSQLRDYVDYALQTGRQMDLYVRSGTTLSAQVTRLVQAGVIMTHTIPIRLP